MIDLISRQAAIEMLKKLLYETALVNSHNTTITKMHEREEIPEDLWDIIMRLQEELE